MSSPFIDLRSLTKSAEKLVDGMAQVVHDMGQANENALALVVIAGEAKDMLKEIRDTNAATAEALSAQAADIAAVVKDIRDRFIAFTEPPPDDPVVGITVVPGAESTH